MSENKVLEISAEDAKYLDPNQIQSIQMIDGTNIVVNDGDEEFHEEGQPDEEQYQTQNVEGQQQPQNLRGRGLGALAGIAAGTALLGTAAAIGGALRRPYYGYGYGCGYGYGYPMMAPMMPMMGPRMVRPMRPMRRGLFF